MRAKFGVLEQIQGLHLQAKIHLNVFIVSVSGGQKPQFSANFDIFWELLYRLPFTDEGQIWYPIADPRYTFTCEVTSRCLFCRPVAAQNPNFAVFWTSAFSDVPIGISLRKLTTGAQLQTFLYPTASKSFLYSNDFMAKSDAQSLTSKSVTDRQTDKNSTFLATPAAGEIRAPPNFAW